MNKAQGWIVVIAGCLLVSRVSDCRAQSYQWPLASPQVTQDYAEFNGIGNDKFHAGLDLVSGNWATHTCAGTTGVPVYASGTGKVRALEINAFRNFNHLTGNVIIIDHNNGQGPFSLYAHLAAICVPDQATITSQDLASKRVIGIVGKSGCDKLYPPCPKHLHLEFKNRNVLGGGLTDDDPPFGYTLDPPAAYGYQDPATFIYSASAFGPIPVEVTGIGSSQLNVRLAPDASLATVQDSIKLGQQFVAFRKVGNWYQIHLPSLGIDGWVSGSFVAENPGLKQLSVTGAGSAGLKVRSSPTTSSVDKIKVWNQQRFVSLAESCGIGCSRPWHKINLPRSLNFSEGWICGDFLSGDVGTCNNHRPGTPLNVRQKKADGSALAEGASIYENDVIVFNADLSDTDGDAVKLEVEARRVDDSFQGIAITVSSLVASGSNTSTPPKGGLAPAGYHWQARVVDNQGAVSDWVEFGAKGNTDFAVLAGTPTQITPTKPTVITLAVPGQLRDKGGVALDGNGNHYVVGSLNTDNVLPDTGHDIWIGKFNSLGVLSWSTLWDSSCLDNSACKEDYGSGIAVGPSGSVYVAGTVGGFTRVLKLVKYTSGGSQVWAKTLNTGSAGDLGSDLSDVEPKVYADSNENVYVAGVIRNLSVSGGNVKRSFDAFIGKHDSNGVATWGRSFDGSGQDYDSARAVTVDANGDVFVAGFVSNAANSFNLLGETTNDYQPLDAWIAKYDSNGTMLWSRTYNGTANKRDIFNAIAVVPSGGVITCGSTFVDDQADSFLLRKYDASGNVVWTTKTTFNTYDPLGHIKEFGNAVSLDSVGNIYVSVAVPGSFSWLAKFSPQGRLLWRAKPNVPALLGAALRDDGTIVSVGGGTGFAVTSSPYYPASVRTLQIQDDAHTLAANYHPQSIIAAESMPKSSDPLSSVSLGTSSITWRWSDTSYNEAGFRVLSAEGESLSGDLSEGTTTWIEAGLLPGQNYQRHVAAFNSEGSSVLTVAGCTEPAAPTELSVNPIDFYSVQGVIADGQNPPGIDYQMIASANVDFSINVTTVTTVSQAPMLRGLLPETTYYLRVAALNCRAVPAYFDQVVSAKTPPVPPAVYFSTLGSAGGGIATPDQKTAIRLTAGVRENSTIFLSTDPVSVPILAAPEDIQAADDALPATTQKSPGSATEFTLFAEGQASSDTLSGSITLPYANTDKNDRIDGTNPAIKVSDLRLYRLEGQQWKEETSPVLTLDKVKQTITASITRLSVYALIGTPAVPPCSEIRAYPIPWKPGSGGRFDSANGSGCGQGMVFDQLPVGATIRIYNLQADLVRELGIPSSSSGCIAWDGKNEYGRDVASGIYLAAIQGTADNDCVKKLAIER